MWWAWNGSRPRIETTGELDLEFVSAASEPGEIGGDSEERDGVEEDGDTGGDATTSRRAGAKRTSIRNDFLEEDIFSKGGSHCPGSVDKFVNPWGEIRKKYF